MAGLANNDDLLAAFAPPSDGVASEDHVEFGQSEGDLLSLSPIEIQTAEALMEKYSWMSRFYAYALKSGAAYNDEWFKDWSTVSVKSLAPLFAIIGTLGVTRIKDVPMGVAIRSDVHRMSDESAEVLRASLCDSSMKSVLFHTDRTLAVYVARIAGAVCEIVGGMGHLRLPGSPDLEVFVSGPNMGRIKSGGQEFVEWLSEAFHVDILYTVISSDVKILSRFFSAHRTVIRGKGDKAPLQFKEVEKNPSNFVELRVINKQLTFYLSPLQRAIVAGYSAETRSQTVSAKDQLTFIEWYLQKAFDLHPELVGGVAPILAEISKLAEEVKAGFTRRVDNLNFVDWLSMKVIPYTKIPLANLGAASKFVESTRAIRATSCDVPRKHDGPEIGRIADGATSVPAKFRGMLDELLTIHGKDVPVLAIGTHKANWWGAEIKERFKTVLFADKDAKYSTVGQFAVKDILSATDFKENSLAGKLLLDDTLPGVGSEFILGTKIDTILRSKPAGGFAKMYLGADFMAGVPMESLIRTPELALGKYKELREMYSYVAFFPGSTPHSQEYFVMYSGLKPMFPQASTNCMMWVPPPKTKVDDVSGGTRGNVSINSAFAREAIHEFLVFSVRWHLVKMVDMIRSNVWQTLQACSGFFVGPIVPKMVYPNVKSVVMNGTEFLGKVPNAVHLRPDGEESLLSKMGF